MLEDLQPRNINDFIPLIQVSTRDLAKVQKRILKEKNQIPEGNRIYYFSKRLDVEPIVVSKHFATHLFIFDVPIDQLVENLNVMFEYKISPDNILCDLWAFNYLPKLVRSRLERSKKSGLGELKLWMIRCTEEILERSVTLSLERKGILGKHTAIEYIARRLEFDIKTMKFILSNRSKVTTVHAAKVKAMLDYLLNDEKFAPFQVASVIVILFHSLEKIKTRINELKELGHRPTSLNTVCFSQRNYDKFLKSLIDQREKQNDKK